jgi:broad specificity phosphatase PhoE
MPRAATFPVIVAFVVLVQLAAPACAPPVQQDGEVSAALPTTVLLVRHAERAEGGDDPSLNATGQARAEELARVAADAGVVAIYSSQYHRNTETAAPLAERLGLPVTVVELVNGRPRDAMKELAARIRAEHAGQTVLVVGHSNTVPMLVQELGADRWPELLHEDYDDLFVVTVRPGGGAQWLHLHYGEVSP